jgi:hypothetical protein
MRIRAAIRNVLYVLNPATRRREKIRLCEQGEASYVNGFVKGFVNDCESNVKIVKAM